MLSAESAAVIRSTLPAVAGALDEITARFYGAMFRDRPELLDGMFNRGNQASGAQRRALAGSIAGFATALLADPDTRPDTLLDRIAHKHAAVGVTDDQYTIVHKYLFGAIAEVLGDAVTPEVAAAWDEVYWLMAGALIGREARLYQDAGVRPGEVWRDWTVVGRRVETPDVVSFLLRPADGRPAPRARAGQYVSVRVLMADGVHQLRQYSLSSDPGGDLRRITVKRVVGTADAPAGEVSNVLHDRVSEGDRLTLSAPFGDVFLDEPADAATPVVLISAGIGGTPMTGMLAHLAALASSRPVLVLHADRSPAEHALRAETGKLVGQLPAARAVFWYEHPGAEEPDAREGLMDLDGIELPENATVFLCGPLPFMRGVRAQLLAAGVPAQRIRYEVFGPDLWLPGPAA
ncbi:MULTISPECIES: globin domain-containing protein [unclassified Streptomyces]|uniref:globin domain-containing protein n=1 Tax=unclassified Streptomyces TaxID=2593676 RepID=UPI00136AFF17|nr:MULTISPECIES: globin domain-containing protein [unclassified Streptomyces]NDZ99880.1 hemin transporter [Streptomyces sp. SID10116]MYY83187.1 hemin transporter [Streptomyces sp. SID335]MYZ15015.1 hemin transporter [Streptomyces sp. SID337]NDZ85862.1 hemin transporter [Streptomyces sp. SID10115]NEB45755.1 hemin transporter [Streptomyces sp. SID339]